MLVSSSVPLKKDWTPTCLERLLIVDCILVIVSSNSTTIDSKYDVLPSRSSSSKTVVVVSSFACSPSFPGSFMWGFDSGFMWCELPVFVLLAHCEGMAKLATERRDRETLPTVKLETTRSVTQCSKQASNVTGFLWH